MALIQSAACTQSIELEFKYGFERRNFRALLGWLKSVSHTTTKSIVNHYFDTPEFDLYKSGFRLRLRIVDNNFAALSLKTVLDAPVYQGAAPKKRREQEWQIPLSLADDFLEGKRNPVFEKPFPSAELSGLSKKKLKKVEALGHSSVMRTSARFQGIPFELDHAFILGHEFFELEIETSEDDLDVDGRVQALLWDQSIEFELNPPGKTKRFTELYTEN